ncbi:hypothetical protein RCZ04_09270 [Capnocytophaga sp. HP1101]
MLYRPATPADVRKVATVLTDAFAPYNMYRAVLSSFFTSEAKYLDYLNKLHYVQAMSNIRKGYCLIAEEGGEIIAVAVMQSLQHTRITLWDYLRSGALALWCYAKPTYYFLPFLEKSSEHAKAQPAEHLWYLESFVVSPAWQGKHIGGKFLDEAVLPFVKKEGGTHLSLVTNTESNVAFYKKHSFEQIHQTKVGGVEVWTMLANLLIC